MVSAGVMAFLFGICCTADHLSMMWLHVFPDSDLAAFPDGAKSEPY
jgi:hypothetical protein